MHFSMLIPLMLFLPLLASGLFFPGYLAGRITGTPAPLLSGFLGSAVILFYTVLGLDGLGVRLSAASIGGALVLINLLLLILFSRRRTPCAPVRISSHRLRPRGWEWLWLVPPVLALGAIALRATADPLSGFDNIFRWDFLARQMLKTGTLSFYPPMTSADFTLYGWCDGIPPLVPVLNLWSYLAAGKVTAIATTPRVMIEAGLLFYAVWRLARGLWGTEAGWPAIAALSTSGLLLWGVAMGQETGLTALTLVTMFVFLDEQRRGGGTACLFWAGVAAGAGAICREYALVWPIIGLLTLAWWGGLRAGWKPFLATAGLIAAPWYLRNWLHTGNPLYAQRVGGVFPTNPVHHEWMGIVEHLFSIGGHPEMAAFGISLVALLAGVILGLALWGFFRTSKKSAMPLGVAGVAVGVLWWWSVGQTAGGWAYSMRVLTPMLALAAVLAGGALATLRTNRCWAAAILITISADAAMRSLYLPVSPQEAPWKMSVAHWLKSSRELDQGSWRPIFKIIAETAGQRGIVVDHPLMQVRFFNFGAKPVPIFSPQAAPMFDDKLSFSEVLATLRATGLKFVILSKHNDITDTLAENHAFLRELRARKPVFSSVQISLYDLDFIKP